MFNNAKLAPKYDSFSCTYVLSTTLFLIIVYKIIQRPSRQLFIEELFSYLPRTTSVTYTSQPFGAKASLE